MTLKERAWISVLGPGILYAAAAVGVSHLVQATRAGASYGLGLLLVILFASLVKYPSLRFGGEYAAATGRSLVASYKAQGWPLFTLYAFSQLFSMVFVVAAVALFTAGLLQAWIGFRTAPIVGVSGLLGVVVLLLLFGRYQFLERFTKLIVVLFTLLIMAAFVFVLPEVNWSQQSLMPPALDVTTVLFIAALIGFMPTPTDGAVLQSLWTLAREEQTGNRMTPAESRLDFNVGFITSVLLAVCFVVMGTGVMYQSGEAISGNNATFAAQLLSLFTATLGDWSLHLIALAAVCVMFSTLIALVDGMARVALAIGTEVAPDRNWQGPIAYRSAISLLAIAAIGVIFALLDSFTAFMDMTSVLVFLLSPFLALLNHRALFNPAFGVADPHRPGPGMRWWSQAGIGVLALLACVYFYYRWA